VVVCEEDKMVVETTGRNLVTCRKCGTTAPAADAGRREWMVSSRAATCDYCYHEELYALAGEVPALRKELEGQS